MYIKLTQSEINYFNNTLKPNFKNNMLEQHRNLITDLIQIIEDTDTGDIYAGIDNVQYDGVQYDIISQIEQYLGNRETYTYEHVNQFLQ